MYKNKRDISDEITKQVVYYNRMLHKYGRTKRSYGAGEKLRVDQIHLITIIGKNSGCSLRLLADYVDQDPPTLSLQVDRLIKLGFVKKQRSSEKLREIEISLTEQGETVFAQHQKIDETYFSALENLLAGYSKQDLEVIADFLKHIIDIRAFLQDLNISCDP